MKFSPLKSNQADKKKNSWYFAVSVWSEIQVAAWGSQYVKPTTKVLEGWLIYFSFSGDLCCIKFFGWRETVRLALELT